jgi:excisionase family DNA binding protein
MSDDQSSKLVQFKEVAEHFDVSVQTVRNWVRDKKIPFLKLGNVYRFRIKDIEESLLSETQSHLEEDDEEAMTESQIQSGISRVNSLGMLWYRRSEHRKQIREIIGQRPFRQKIITHLYTGIPIKLSVEEIAEVFQLEVDELREVLARQSILLHPRYFTEDLHNALMEELEKDDEDRKKSD